MGGEAVAPVRRKRLRMRMNVRLILACGEIWWKSEEGWDMQQMIWLRSNFSITCAYQKVSRQCWIESWMEPLLKAKENPFSVSHRPIEYKCNGMGTLTLSEVHESVTKMSKSMDCNRKTVFLNRHFAWVERIFIFAKPVFMRIACWGCWGTNRYQVQVSTIHNLNNTHFKTEFPQSFHKHSFKSESIPMWPRKGYSNSTRHPQPMMWTHHWPRLLTSNALCGLFFLCLTPKMYISRTGSDCTVSLQASSQKFHPVFSFTFDGQCFHESKFVFLHIIQRTIPIEHADSSALNWICVPITSLLRKIIFRCQETVRNLSFSDKECTYTLFANSQLQEKRSPTDTSFDRDSKNHSGGC
jgi:hypothetical protein